MKAHLAFDTYATIDAACHPWQFVDRLNIMVKIPATVPGLQAIERLIAEGINVNVTLLFSIDGYKAVREAYIRGVSQNPHPHKVASVASFFINQVDIKVDALLEEIGTPESRKLKGCIAIANAKLAYQLFKETLDSTQYKAQQQRGTRPQRLLWNSTSTVNDEYSDSYDQLLSALKNKCFILAKQYAGK